MKKSIFYFLILSVILLLVGCGGKSSSQKSASAPGKAPSKNEVSKNETSKSETSKNETSKKEDTKKESSKDSSLSSPSEKVDIDLAEENATMAFSQLYQMGMTPEEYEGKRVRIKGSFTVSQGPSKDSYYFAVVITDATACCMQGLEFVLADSRKYPDEYPRQGEEITVEGEFQSYTDNGYTYCHLINAKMDS